MREAVEAAIAVWALRPYEASPSAAIDTLARLTPEERLRRNDRLVDGLMEAIDQLRRQRGP